jgi:hypothetical protein
LPSKALAADHDCQAMPDTVSDAIVRILMQWSIDTVFGLPGDGINGLVEAFRRAKDRMGVFAAVGLLVWGQGR